MYPAINLATGGFTNPAPQATPTAGYGAGAGPASPPEGTAATSLRVVIAEPFRLAPPVPIPQGADLPSAPSRRSSSSTSIASAQFASASFDFERSVLQELEGDGPPTTTSTIENGLPQQDRYEALVSRAVSQGCSRESAVLGLVIAVGSLRERADGGAVLDAAHKVQQMQEMGFSAGAAAGALIARNCNLQGALDMATA